MTEILLFEMPVSITEDELREALVRLPRWRLTKALKYRYDVDKFLCAKAYLLLEEGLYRTHGITGPLEFEYTPSGKPLLAGHKDIHFNLSHCSSCVCCIIADRPAGIDVENIIIDQTLAESVCNEEELANIRSAQDPAIEFTKLWTRKESYLKMTGEGLQDNMKDVLKNCGVTIETTVNKERGYVLSSTIID